MAKRTEVKLPRSFPTPPVVSTLRVQKINSKQSNSDKNPGMWTHTITFEIVAPDKVDCGQFGEQQLAGETARLILCENTDETWGWGRVYQFFDKVTGQEIADIPDQTGVPTLLRDGSLVRGFDAVLKSVPQKVTGADGRPVKDAAGNDIIRGYDLEVDVAQIVGPRADIEPLPKI